MAHHNTETDSVPSHIEGQSYLSGSLEQSPGNQDLVAPVDQTIEQLLKVEAAQSEIAAMDQRLRGAAHFVLVLLDPVVRELEMVEKAYIASPAGKSWTPAFETSAPALLGRSTQDERDAALKRIDEAVTKPDCPAVFKEPGKRYHDLYKKHAALLALKAKNEARHVANRDAAAKAKHASVTVSHQTEGHLQARLANQTVLIDAHFKPAPPKRKKDDPKQDELQKKNAELSTELTDVQQKYAGLAADFAALQATNDALHHQLADAEARAAAAASAAAAGTSTTETA